MPQDLSVDWHVQHLRFSVFLPQPTQPEPVGFWANVVGQDADDTHIKGTGSQRVVTQQGPFRDARMRAEVRIDRVDWFLGPSLPPTPDDMPVAVPYDGLIDQGPLATFWLRLKLPVSVTCSTNERKRNSGESTNCPVRPAETGPYHGASRP